MHFFYNFIYNKICSTIVIEWIINFVVVHIYINSYKLSLSVAMVGQLDEIAIIAWKYSLRSERSSYMHTWNKEIQRHDLSRDV